MAVAVARSNTRTATGGVCLAPRAVVHPLEHPRDGEYEGRPERGQVAGDPRDIAVTHVHALVQHGDLQHPAEHVGQRQEQQRRPVFVLEQLRQHLDRAVTSARKLPWVSSQPFGRPVVPEV